MSFARYEHYKDSGVEWLGEVPAHWSNVSLRWVSTRYSGGTPDKLNHDYWTDGTIPWLNSGAVNQGLISEPSTFITQEAYENSSAKWIPPGALVMALAGQGKTKGMVAQLTIPSTCNQSMAAIVPNEEMAPRFLYWWLASNYQNIRKMAGGDLRDGLNLELLGSIPCPLPTIEEQTAIAAFLDRETAKLDALVAEQQRLIELLKEKRQAVISHAVTKGLNPDAPMKDFGIEWLGEVPAHWAVCALNYRYEVLLGKMLDEKRITGEHLAPYLRNVDVQWGQININDLPEMDFKGDDLVRYALKPGDLLVCEGGDVGRAAIWGGQLQECYYQKALHRLRSRNENGDAAGFLFYVLYAAAKLGLFVGSVGKSTIAHLTAETLRRYQFAFPPCQEQQSISTFLDREAAKFDELTAEAQRAITLLQERRTALISAAVTGKIDVRGAMAGERETV